MIEIPLSPLYSFPNALRVIQKGKEDPLNIFENENFIRLIYINNKKLLVTIFSKSNFLYAKVLVGDLDDDSYNILKNLLTRLFGLDDPLLYLPISLESLSIIPLDSSSVVHGYFSIFEAIVHTILGQLISAKVANNLSSRFIRIFGEPTFYKQRKYFTFPSPQSIQNLSVFHLRELGISKAKSKSIINVAKEFCTNNLESRLLTAKNSEDIRMMLLGIYGVGKWTSDWVSLRALRKFEIIPSGDLIIRKSFSWWLNVPYILSSKDIDETCKNWFPYGGSLAYRIMLSYINKSRLN